MVLGPQGVGVLMEFSDKKIFGGQGERRIYGIGNNFFQLF
jgi:hypothetical protein